MKKWLVTVVLGFLIVCAAAGGTLAVYTKSQAFSGTLTLEPASSEEGGGESSDGVWIPVPSGKKDTVVIDEDGTISISGSGSAILSEAYPYQASPYGYRILFDVSGGQKNGSDEGVFIGASYQDGVFLGYCLSLDESNNLLVTSYSIDADTGKSQNAGGKTVVSSRHQFAERGIPIQKLRETGLHYIVVVQPIGGDNPGSHIYVYLGSDVPGFSGAEVQVGEAWLENAVFCNDPLYVGVRAKNSNKGSTVFSNLVVENVDDSPIGGAGGELHLAPPATSPDAATIEVSGPAESSETSAESEKTDS